MISPEKCLKKKDCTEIIASEVERLVELDFSQNGIFLYKSYSHPREQPKSD